MTHLENFLLWNIEPPRKHYIVQYWATWKTFFWANRKMNQTIFYVALPGQYKKVWLWERLLSWGVHLWEISILSSQLTGGRFIQSHQENISMSLVEIICFATTVTFRKFLRRVTRGASGVETNVKPLLFITQRGSLIWSEDDLYIYLCIYKGAFGQNGVVIWG